MSGKCLAMLLVCLLALACACGRPAAASSAELAYIIQPTMAPDPAPPIVVTVAGAGDLA